MEQLLSLKRFE